MVIKFPIEEIQVPDKKRGLYNKNVNKIAIIPRIFVGLLIVSLLAGGLGYFGFFNPDNYKEKGQDVLDSTKASYNSITSGISDSFSNLLNSDAGDDKNSQNVDSNLESDKDTLESDTKNNSIVDENSTSNNPVANLSKNLVVDTPLSLSCNFELSQEAPADLVYAKLNNIEESWWLPTAECDYAIDAIRVIKASSSDNLINFGNAYRQKSYKTSQSRYYIIDYSNAVVDYSLDRYKQAILESALGSPKFLSDVDSLDTVAVGDFSFYLTEGCGSDSTKNCEIWRVGGDSNQSELVASYEDANLEFVDEFDLDNVTLLLSQPENSIKIKINAEDPNSTSENILN